MSASLPRPAAGAAGRGARALAAAALLAVSACGAHPGGTAWDGRRGYDGRGDYGYDLDASRAEARGYRARASRNYPVPGPPGDPWGPYVREAAARFAVPERWIREVMRQESGGRLRGADGSLTTSPVGAMGLMQVMPATYDVLRQRYGLGADPYEPRDNILAGAAYIREMFDRFGAPAFLAAYNAGPDRVDAFLAGGAVLPDETVNYLARVAPRLGTEVATTGPLAVYAGAAPQVARNVRAPEAVAYDAGTEAVADDPADRAFDGGGLVTATMPTGTLTGQGLGGDARPVPAPLPVAAYALPAPARPAMPAFAPAPAPWAIQVGAFPNPAASRASVAAARSRAGGLLAGAQPAIIPVERGGLLYRARLIGLSAETAAAACAALSRGGMACFAVPPGS